MIEHPILVPRPIFQPNAKRNNGRLIQCGNKIAQTCRDALALRLLWPTTDDHALADITSSDIEANRGASIIGFLFPTIGEIKAEAEVSVVLGSQNLNNRKPFTVTP